MPHVFRRTAGRCICQTTLLPLFLTTTTSKLDARHGSVYLIVMFMMAASFQSLPNETLRSIRGNLHSLLDIVHFSQISRRTSQICDEAYWKWALKEAGFSRPLQTSVKLPHTWAGLARVICADWKMFEDDECDIGVSEDALVTKQGRQSMSPALAVSPTCCTVIHERSRGHMHDSMRPDRCYEQEFRFDGMFVERVDSETGNVMPTEPQNNVRMDDFLISGREVVLNWSSSIENVWWIRRAGHYLGGRARHARRTLCHPVMFCRLICSSGARDMVVAEIWHTDTPQLLHNADGVVYGDVMRAQKEESVYATDLRLWRSC